MTDIENLSQWIGKQDTPVTDTITTRMEESLQATLGPNRAAVSSNAASVGMFWCLAPAIVAPEKLGGDGHPAKGDFLPPVALPRRMWASGELEFFHPLELGQKVTKHSSIHDIKWKEGKSGTLCFVTVAHGYKVDDETAISEKQNLVYRAAAASPAPPPHPNALGKSFDHEWAVPVTNTQLFRYSALTFNGHRIHYDADYARQVEFYSDLVIHGPLQATLMLNLATHVGGRTPKRFSFRGVSPATGSQTLNIGADMDGDTAALSVVSEAGVETMKGTAEW